MDLIKELNKFDLSDNEAKVYLACLEIGPGSIQEIAEKAKLNRVTVYGIAEELLAKGFLREEKIKAKRKIAAYPPMKLYDVVSRREEKIKRQANSLEVLVPELKQLMGHKENKTNIIYYEGEEGMRNWASDALEAAGELLEWTKIESFSKKFNEYLQSYYFPEKAKRQIPSRFIFLDTPGAHEYVKINYLDKKNAPPMKARFISPADFETPGFMAIFNDRYTIAIPSEMRAVSVVDQLIADAQRKIWEFGWLNAKGEVQNKPYPLDK